MCQDDAYSGIVALTVLSVVLVAIATFVIAAGIVGGETHRLDGVAPSPAFDLDEAVMYIADRLSFEASAALSHDDVRAVVSFSLEYFRNRGTLKNGSKAYSPGPAVIVQGAETVEYVHARAVETGMDLTIEQIYAVLDVELSYLEAIGAVGPEALEDPRAADD